MTVAAANPCPLCAAPSSHALSAVDRNRRTTNEQFAYRRCDACRTVFMGDVPDDISRYYAGGYYQFDEAGAPRWATNPALLDAEDFRVRRLQRYEPAGELLDIGAGPGAFASAARAAGFAVSAIEMDDECCEYMRESLGVRAVCSRQPAQELADLPVPRVITMWHVLEHLPNPAEVLSACAQRLPEGGILALGLPNPESLQFRLLGARWPHLDAPRHVFLPTARALLAHCRALGLERLDLFTDDPFGRSCDYHGWAYALRRHPEAGETSRAVLRAAQAVTVAMIPLERSGLRGSAFTLLLRKSAREHRL